MEIKVKYKIIYGEQVSSFPTSALDVLKRAGAADVKVLLCLCSEDGGADIKKLTKLTGCDADEVRDALSFWRGAGIVEPDKTGGEQKLSRKKAANADTRNTDAEDKQDQKTEKKLARANELPSYTSDQLSNIVESREEIATLINECQNIMGKMFSVREINVLIGLVDYLGLDCEYIMMLLTYCVSIDKKTLHYAEKMAFSLYDAGICTPESLGAEFEKRDRINGIENKIRSLFGLGARAFTTKEKKLIASWVNDMGYGADIIEKAYEVTADTTSNASIPYANSVLERWNAAGLRTLDDIERSYQQKDKSALDASSFDTDSFFAAAVRRALGDD